MLGPPDVGQRVVIRRIVGVREDRPLYSDVLGYLAAVTGTDLVLEADGGSPLRVPAAAVVAAKRVPPRRVTASGQIAALERAAGEAWPAPEIAPLGDWLLRAAGGWTGRANSALPLGDPGRPLTEALAEVTRWYAARGLPARVNVPLPLCAPVDAALAAAGWTALPEVLVLTVPTRALALADPNPAQTVPGPTGPTPSGPARAGLERTAPGPVVLSREPDADALALIAGHKGALPPQAYPVLCGPACVRFAAVRDPAGALLAVARGAVTRRRLHLSLIQVVPAQRRQGLATAVLRELARWGDALGAHTSYLQVEHSNTPAVRLYQRLGFTSHHTYLTRTALTRTAP